MANTLDWQIWWCMYFCISRLASLKLPSKRDSALALLNVAAMMVHVSHRAM